MSSESASGDAIMEALSCVGLDKTLIQLDKGLHTRLAATGWPLSITEMMQLKLAAAILARPKLLILNQIFDVMVKSALARSLDLLQKQAGTTVIYFSNREADLDYSHYLYLGATEQEYCPSLKQLRELAAARDKAELRQHGRAA
jgi:putative ABC transport system ATP-binding protein